MFAGGLLAAGGPGGEHGGIDGERGLREPFVLQCRLGIHATLGVVGQQPVEFLCKECRCEVLANWAEGCKSKKKGRVRAAPPTLANKPDYSNRLLYVTF